MKDSFLYNTARDIVSCYGWEGLRDVTLVFPSHRAGLVLKHELKQLQREQHPLPVFLPKITTLSELFDSLSPLQPEDELRLICRLYRIYRSVTGENITLDVFYGWGRQIISDFNNIDKAVPEDEVRAFFDNTVAARELEEVKLDEEVSRRLKDLLRQGGAPEYADEQSIRRKYDLLWRNLYTIYVQLNRELAEEQKGYEGARMRAALQHLQQTENAAPGTCCFVGFNYLLRVEKELMLWYKAHCASRFYWDYVEPFPANANAFAFIEKHKQDLGNAAAPLLWTEAKEVDVVSTVTGNAQAQFVAPWLQRHYTAKGEQTAVVISDEGMLEPVIYALPSVRAEGMTEDAPINITKGFPLANTQVYAKVTDCLDQLTTDKGNRLDYKDVQAVLAQLLAAAEAAEQADMPAASEHVEDWHTLLMRESVYQMRCAINRFAQLTADPLLREAVSSRAVLRNLFKQHLTGISLPFNGEPITDIQVMGVLETRMLDFDNLLILNVEEGVVPRQQADLSFIPYYLRKTYHMPTRDEGATVYAYNFFRLMARAKHVTIVFSEAETAMGRKSMSRFVMQMLVNPQQFRVHKYSLAESSGSVLSDGGQDAIDLAPGHAEIKSLSPSAISTYIECPRKFYWQYVEKLRPIEPDTLIFASNTLGTFVHRMMQDLYSGQSRVDKRWISGLESNRALLEETLRKAYGQIGEDTGIAYCYEHHQMENSVIIEFVRNILRRDAKDAEEQGLEMVLTEQKRYFEMAGVRVGGIIDRMDKVGGQTRVVDYKTGSYNPNKLATTWEDLFASPDAHYVLQTLIYSEAAVQEDNGRHVCPNLYFTQKNLLQQESRVSIDGQTVDDYQDVRERFLSGLETLVKEIKTAVAYPRLPDKQCSPYCPFLTLCRRQPKER